MNREQPFPVDVHLPEADRQQACAQWMDVKKHFNASGILLFADESMRTAGDVPLLSPYVNGVNIKLEKCGGFRAALLAVEAAKKEGLLVWFGCMVGSNVNSTATAHLFSLSCCSDLDGALLVTPESQVFSGGFQYSLPRGNILLPSGGGDDCCGWGIGVTPTRAFEGFVRRCGGEWEGAA